jgi:3-deoxy-manno-octulosonate cytidylyltransferase (CMP-KDO synthetase)
VNNLVVIPARLNSSRLPNKVLLKVQGKSIIEYVYRQVEKSQLVDKIIVATDSEIVLKDVNNFGGEAVLTSSKHQSGTDRVAEVAKKYNFKNIINVQGDEPNISPNLIDSLFFELENEKVYFVSAMSLINSFDEVANPNVVKVICDINNYAIYFSRSQIPFIRDNDFQVDFFKHIGIYGFKKDFLIKYSKLPQTNLELSEKLEQLRAIENGYKIKMVKTDYNSFGIDTLEDFENFKKFILNNKI